MSALFERPRIRTQVDLSEISFNCVENFISGRRALLRRVEKLIFVAVKLDVRNSITLFSRSKTRLGHTVTALD